MTTKIKISIGLLAVLAVVFVFSFFESFRGIQLANISNPVSSIAPVDPNQDTDHDGLTDSQESYWGTDYTNPDSDGDGYLDGEEVASGHDPMIPGPNDLLLNNNLTSKAANLLIGGLAEGSLQPDSKNYGSSLSDLTDSLLSDGIKDLAPSNPPQITIVDSSKESQQQYVDYSTKTWKSFMDLFVDEIKNMGNKIEATNNGGFVNEEYISYFKSKRDEFQKIADSLAQAKVPTEWKDAHVSFYQLISEMIIINKALSEANDDTIKAAIAFSFLSKVSDNIPQAIKAYADKVQTEGLVFNFPK